MTVQDWFEKRKQAQIQRRELEGRVELDMDPNLWTKCVHCDAQLLKEDLVKNDILDNFKETVKLQKTCFASPAFSRCPHKHRKKRYPMPESSDTSSFSYSAAILFLRLLCLTDF